MLDPWVIEEIRRREEEQRQREENRSRVEINIETPSEYDRGSRPARPRGEDGGRPRSERGVAIIDFSI